MKAFNELIDNMMILANEVINKGGDLHFEWPSQCSLWHHDKVKEMVRKFAMHKVDIHGCALGLKSKGGEPIKKPWSLMTTSKNLIDSFAG